MLTESQQKVWTYLQWYYSEHGHRPSNATISQNFGFASNNSAVSYVEALAAKGYALPDHAKLPSNSDAMDEIKAWRKAFRGHYFDGQKIVDGGI